MRHSYKKFTSVNTVASSLIITSWFFTVMLDAWNSLCMVCVCAGASLRLFSSFQRVFTIPWETCLCILGASVVDLINTDTHVMTVKTRKCEQKVILLDSTLLLTCHSIDCRHQRSPVTRSHCLQKNGSYNPNDSSAIVGMLRSADFRRIVMIRETWDLDRSDGQAGENGVDNAQCWCAVRSLHM